jgi:hypothetical protein
MAAARHAHQRAHRPVGLRARPTGATPGRTRDGPRQSGRRPGRGGGRLRRGDTGATAGGAAHERRRPRRRGARAPGSMRRAGRWGPPPRARHAHSLTPGPSARAQTPCELAVSVGGDAPGGASARPASRSVAFTPSCLARSAPQGAQCAPAPTTPDLCRGRRQGPLPPHLRVPHAACSRSALHHRLHLRLRRGALARKPGPARRANERPGDPSTPADGRRRSGSARRRLRPRGRVPAS